LRQDGHVSGGGTCSMCGRAQHPRDRHVRFTLPDPVLDTADQCDARGAWMSHDDPNRSVMMQVPGVGAFIRALLPVALSGGFTVTFGVWLAVHPDELRRAFGIWWEPEYRTLALDGRLANAVPPWGLLAAPVRAVVRYPNQTPYCDSSMDERLAAVLTNEWPHDLVLDAIGDR